MEQPRGALSNATPETLRDLDLAAATTEELLAFMAHIARTHALTNSVVGRVTAEVRSRGGISFRDIEAATGIPIATLSRWSAPYSNSTRGEPTGGDSEAGGT
jgi:uncharacterized protein YerC